VSRRDATPRRATLLAAAQKLVEAALAASTNGSFDRFSFAELAKHHGGPSVATARKAVSMFPEVLHRAGIRVEGFLVIVTPKECP
jgi:hypothetical protein